MQKFDAERYKVRAKQKNENVWVLGFLYVNDIGTLLLGGDCACEVEPETVSRAVGITDPSGVRVYENDIVVWLKEETGEILESCVIIYDDEMGSFLMLNENGEKVDVDDNYFVFGTRFDEDVTLSDKQKEYFTK